MEFFARRVEFFAPRAGFFARRPGLCGAGVEAQQGPVGVYVRAAGVSAMRMARGAATVTMEQAWLRFFAERTKVCARLAIGFALRLQGVALPSSA